MVPEESSAEDPESLLAKLLGKSQEDTLPVSSLLSPERSELELESVHVELEDLFDEVATNVPASPEIDDLFSCGEESPSVPTLLAPPPQNEDLVFKDIFSLDIELTKLLEVNENCQEVSSLCTSQFRFSPTAEVPVAIKERASKEAQILLKGDVKARKPKKSVPALLKTEAYVDKRRRNNLSAAMCRSNEREARAAKRCRYEKAKEKNVFLRQKIAELEEIASKLEATTTRV